MSKKDAFQVVKSRYITEKSKVLENLRLAESNRSVKACESPKYVFLVDKRANKYDIAAAVEEIYADKKIKVTKVNTINTKGKERRIRGRLGFKPGFKKAVVTLKVGQLIEETV